MPVDLLGVLGTAIGFTPNFMGWIRKKRKKGTLENLFFTAFVKALQTPGKKYGTGLKELGKNIKKDKQGFLSLFIIEEAVKQPGEFLEAFKTPAYREKAAERIIEKFSLGENL